ncbi:FG-GAP-like repeat-containing protein [Luteolibacter marinus]|uniref:FG-GAP-like repeat-containing protein n=1 Tax=Luteolibacter marinus TaxID=2776705 RepID=UPI001868A2D4|nr:carboxypeptidase regulatory-like domain-containing protein [Luteolibacter marinus]
MRFAPLRFAKGVAAFFPMLMLPLAAVPANDDFADAGEIVVDQPLPITVSGNTLGATVEAGEIALDPTLAATVWYRVTSPADGVVRFDTDGSDFQNRLAVAVGTGYGDLVIVAADDDPDDGTAVTFEVEEGVEYLILVAGWNGATGNLTLNLRETEGASISGHVTASPGGAALGQVSVQAWVFREAFGRWQVVGRTTTNAFGGYTLTGLNPGASYRVRALDEAGLRAPRFFTAETFVEDATPVVPDPDLFGIDLALVPAGTISGQVGLAGGPGAEGITVQAYLWNSTSGAWEIVASTSSGPGGDYTLSGLAAGTYRVGFLDEAGGVYLPAFVSGADLESAADIAVGVGSLVEADASVVMHAGSIHGVVRSAATGQPVAGVQVQAIAYDSTTEDWEEVGQRALSGEDGSYVLSGLPYDSYRVVFADFSDGLLLPSLFGGTIDPLEASPVVLSAGAPEALAVDQVLSTLQIEVVAFASEGVAALGFPGNPFAQFVIEGTDDTENWSTEGMPFHPVIGPNSMEVPAAGARRFWRLRGPENLQLAPDPGIHLRTSYTQAQANYRWIDRYQFGNGFFDFISAFGYGDFDGDGKGDVLVFPGAAYTFDPFPATLTRDLDGTRSDGSVVFAGGVPGCIHARKLLVGDLNGDSVDDAVLIDHGYDADPFPGAPLKVLLSSPGGTVQTVSYPEHTGFHHAGALGDFDHDGDLDLFLAAPADLGGVNLILANDGLGGFSPVNQLVGDVWEGNIWASEFFDLDGDGFLDLAIGAEVGTDPATVLWGSNRGTYGADALKLELPDGWDVYDYDAEDLDGDGDRDLLVTLASPDSDAHRFVLLINHGSRHFIDETFERFDDPTYTGNWIDFAFVQDVDADGDPDIVADVRGTLVEWKNHGSGVFAAQQ